LPPLWLDGGNFKLIGRAESPGYSDCDQCRQSIGAQLAGITDNGTNNLKFGHNGRSMEFSSLFGQALQTPTLFNGWEQYSPANRSAVGYWIGPDGIVHLQGHITGAAAGIPAFVLPAGYLPAMLKQFAVPSNNAFGLITVDPSTGNVTPQIYGGTFISLDGINFRAGD
jgi:hypothetical protein